jgi:hypothetical protein
MNQAPAFFLSTAGEYEPLVAPRACWAKARLRDAVRDNHMLITIEPALKGQGFGLGAADVTQLIVSARRWGQTLYAISEWPSPSTCLVSWIKPWLNPARLPASRSS